VHAKKVIPNISVYSVTDIPLHPHKKRKRGFNQSQQLARAIADYFHIPYIPLLARVKDTESQTKQKGHAQRFSAVQNCFICTDKTATRGKHILLIDDVCTSGATLWEASRVLQQEHPRRIIALTIAKAD
jgi:predicted amidophosphoribosyltransferase